MPTVTCTTFYNCIWSHLFQATLKEVSPLTQTHKRHRMQPRLDDRVLDAFFLGLPGRCRSKTRCSAFKLWCFVPKNQNEATQKKRSCCNLPKQPLLELLAGPPSHFVSDVFFWDFASLPFHQQQIQQCFSHVFPRKKKRNMSRNLERWPFPSMVYRLHPDISTGLRCSQDKCCVSPFLKRREMSERTHDPNGTAFMAHRTTFALTTWQFIHSKVLLKQQQGGGNIDEKHGSKVWFIFLSYQSNIGFVKCASTSASMIWCWGCYASVPLLKGLASLPQHLTCRIFVEKRLSAEKSPPPFPCWDFWMVSPLRKNKTKKSRQQQNMINLNRFTFHKIQHLIAGKNAEKRHHSLPFLFLGFGSSLLIVSNSFRLKGPQKIIRLDTFSSLHYQGSAPPQRNESSSPNVMEIQSRMISFFAWGLMSRNCQPKIETKLPKGGLFRNSKRKICVNFVFFEFLFEETPADLRKVELPTAWWSSRLSRSLSPAPLWFQTKESR